MLPLSGIVWKKKENGVKLDSRIISLDIPILFQPTDTDCPRVNIATLIREKTGRVEENPLADNEEYRRLESIAKKFEEKYRSTNKKGRKVKFGRPEDYMDLGMGYDRDDPFIDDSAAYDELVPSTLTPIHGGFYVNHGRLEFREISDSEGEEPPQDEPKKKKSRLVRDDDGESSQEAISNGGQDGSKQSKTVSGDDSTPASPTRRTVAMPPHLPKEQRLKRGRPKMTANQKASHNLLSKAMKNKKRGFAEKSESFDRRIGDTVSLVASSAPNIADVISTKSALPEPKRTDDSTPSPMTSTMQQPNRSPAQSLPSINTCTVAREETKRTVAGIDSMVADELEKNGPLQMPKASINQSKQAQPSISTVTASSSDEPEIVAVVSSTSNARLSAESKATKMPKPMDEIPAAQSTGSNKAAVQSIAKLEPNSAPIPTARAVTKPTPTPPTATATVVETKPITIPAASSQAASMAKSSQIPSSNSPAQASIVSPKQKLPPIPVPPYFKELNFKLAKKAMESGSVVFNAETDAMLKQMQAASKQHTLQNQEVVAVLRHLAKLLGVEVNALIKRWTDVKSRPSAQASQAASKSSSSERTDLKASVEKKLITSSTSPSIQPDLNSADLETLRKLLKEEIDRLMPALEEDHKKQSGEIAQKKLDMIQTAEGERPKSLYTPRRKYLWTEHSRNLLKAILTKIMTKIANDSAIVDKAEACRARLEIDIVPLWPQGWMNAREIFKESKDLRIEDVQARLAKQKEGLQQQRDILKTAFAIPSVTIAQTAPIRTVSTVASSSTAPVKTAMSTVASSQMAAPINSVPTMAKPAPASRPTIQHPTTTAVAASTHVSQPKPARQTSRPSNQYPPPAPTTATPAAATVPKASRTAVHQPMATANAATSTASASMTDEKMVPRPKLYAPTSQAPKMVSQPSVVPKQRTSTQAVTTASQNLGFSIYNLTSSAASIPSNSNALLSSQIPTTTPFDHLWPPAASNDELQRRQIEIALLLSASLQEQPTGQWPHYHHGNH